MSTFIRTNSKRHVDYRNPSPKSICIHDIATALSRLPRFCGHTDEFYSVAQHSYYVSWLVRLAGGSTHEQLVALLHDAPEAYTGDIPTPLKRLMPELAIIENRLWRAISGRFLAGCGITTLVKKCDRQMLAIESEDVRDDREGLIYFPAVDLEFPTVVVYPVTAMQSRELFLETFDSLAITDYALEPAGCS